MNQPINRKTTIWAGSNSSHPTTTNRGFLFVALALTWFTLSPAPKAFGVTPAPDGGYPMTTKPGRSSVLRAPRPPSNRRPQQMTAWKAPLLVLHTISTAHFGNDL